MAPRKAKPAPETQKSATPVAARRAVRQDSAAAASGSDPNRLLREAAWSRMFGRTAKNPFAR